MRATTFMIAAALTLMGGNEALGGRGAGDDKAQPAEAKAQPAAAETKAAPSHPELEGAKPVDGHSLYQLEMPLEDQDGQRIALDHYRGHPVIVSLFYASCPAACPLLIKDIQRLEAALSPQARAQLRVVLVSIDPERDTPAALTAAAQRYEVDGARWRLARAEDARVRELAAVLGVKYRREPNGALGHTSRLTLLDGEGVPAGRVDGLGQPVDALAQKVEALTGGRP